MTMNNPRTINLPIIDELLAETSELEKNKILNRIQKDISLEYIKTNWSKIDELLYYTPEIKLASLEASKTKVIAKN